MLDRLVFEAKQQDSLLLLPAVCGEILLHCTVEAGVLIPAIAKLDGGDELLRETGSEFSVVTGLINELSGLALDDNRSAAVLDELRARMFAHVLLAEAPGGLLERASKLALDWHVIGKCLVERRQQLCKTPTVYLRIFA